MIRRSLVKLNRIKRIIGLVAIGRFDCILWAIKVRAKGLDFSPVSLEDLGFSRERSVHHSASGGAYLRQVLRGLAIPKGSRALDLGSGKGAAACTMAEFSFEEVVGIELSERLVRIAESNIRRLNLKNVRFVHADAGRFSVLDPFTHMYMFNPFPAPVIKEMMENLAASLARKPRELTLIYHNPACDDVIMSSGLFRRDMEMTSPLSHPFYIYVHDVQRS